MNKAFKAIWSDARQSFVTTSEKQNSHGKRSKVSVAICAAMLLTTGGFSFAASNNIANTTAVINASAQTWETAEYNRDWGLRAMNASSAYQLGYHGQNVKVGVMDSGAMLQLESQLSGDRFHAMVHQGQYGYDGMRYPQHSPSDGLGEYTAGESYDLTGQFIPVVNNGHGTHVTGTVAGNRDGQEFHGVAWGADVYVANTNATDDINYGPFQDYDYFYNGWKGLVDTGAQVINNSFGTNIRTVNRNSTGLDGNDTSTHLQADTVQQSEYEYFYYNMKYAGKPSFVDAAWDAVKGSTTVQVFTTGNRDMANPFYRPAYPYFNPEAESQWIAVAGIRRLGDTASYGSYDDSLPALYELTDSQCEAGIAKWWTVVAPSVNIQSIWAYDALDENGNPTYRYSPSSGTSMAAPHVTGAMAVLLSRYKDMTGIQAREVLLTTAAHTNADGEFFKNWTAEEGVPDVRYGWGVPNLQKGMYGPGQFLSKFDYNLASTPLDVWSNDISNAALDARKNEDQEWLNNYEKNLNADDFVLGDGFIVQDGDDDPTNHIISLEDAKQWRKDYFEKRKAAIEARMANDGEGYKGALIKRGQGALIMTGTNSYKGGTTLLEGGLYGFSESFGAAPVVVNGGQFGILQTYNDTFTQLGQLTSSVGLSRAEVQKATVIVNDGGTFAVIADQDVQLKSLTFNEGSQITVTSLTNDAFEQAWDGNAKVGTVTAETLEGVNNAIVAPDYALVDYTITVDGNKITGVLEKGDKTLADYANNGNGVSVANALMADEALFSGLLSATKDEARQTIASLANDIHVTANAMTVANGQSLVRAIKDQAIGIDGAARVADVDDGRARLWMSAVGNWSKMDRAGSSKLKSDFYTGLVGLEADINVNNKVGVFFGAGKTKFKGGADGKIDSDDLHFGIYGQSKISDVRLNYGFAYSHQDRDAGTALFYRNQAFASSPSYNAKLAQVFGEVAYTGLNLGTVNVEPYVGLAWMHLSADGFNSDYAGGKASTSFDSQNLAVTNVGARVKVPFEAGAAKLKAVADVNWTQYMGDTRGKSTLKLGNGATAKIQSEKLSAVAAVGVGLEAQLGKSASLGVSYYGAFGSKIKSNGVGATFKYAF